MYSVFVVLCIYLFQVIMKFSIATYNSNGHAPDRMLYINKLCASFDFIFIQEHWLFENEMQICFSKLKGIHHHGISGMSNNELLNGRPYGGVAILWHNSFKGNVTPITTESQRLCAVKITQNGMGIILINAYMPCDTARGNDNIYQSVLNEISLLIEKANCDQIIIGGDFNTDLSRLYSNHTTSLISFVEQENLNFGIHSSKCDVKYSYVSKMNGLKSLIDHFIMSENTFSNIKNIYAYDDGDNLSDHIVICMKLDIDMNYSNECMNKTKPNRVYWDKATDDDIHNYQMVLDENLTYIKIPSEALNCNDLLCIKHKNEIEVLCQSIIDSCIDASKRTIPNILQARSHDNELPGWNDYVENHRQKAIFWHNIWKECNRPREGLLANIRRTTRASYHLAVKRAKNNKDKIISNKLADTLAENKCQDFWKNVKKN